jgi:hypothetical protein
MQRLFGVEARAGRMAMNIVVGLADRHVAVLDRSDLLILAMIADGYPEALLVTGEPGFLRPHPDRLALDVWPEHGLPAGLADRAGNPFDVGTLALDFVDKGRVRVNGAATVHPDGHLTVAVEHAFPNCKSNVVHCVSRLDGAPADDASPAGYAAPAARLTPAEIEFANRTETLFLATSERPDGSVDVAYRGGPAGFVTAAPNRIEFEEYRGNDMFQSLGNLALHPACSISLVSLPERRHVSVAGRGRLHKQEDSQSVVVDIERVRRCRWPSNRGWYRVAEEPDVPMSGEITRQGP